MTDIMDDTVPDMTYNVFGGTLSLTQSINQSWMTMTNKLSTWQAKHSSSHNHITDIMGDVILCTPRQVHSSCLQPEFIHVKLECYVIDLDALNG